MVAVHDIQFPVKISYGAKGGPEFRTTLIESPTGRSQSNIEWSSPRWKWTIDYGLKNRTYFEEILNFFINRKGRAYGFRFKDWNDYKADQSASGNLPVQLTVSTVPIDPTLQLTKTYSDGIYSYIRNITRPVDGTVKLYLQDIEINSLNYSIDYTTGLITWYSGFLNTPIIGDKITADFQFDVPARFDTDLMAASKELPEYSGWQGVDIVEVRE